MNDQFMSNTTKLVIAKGGGFLGGLTAYRVVTHLLAFAVPATLPARVVYAAGTIVLAVVAEYNVEKLVGQQLATALDEIETSYKELDGILEEIMS